MGLPPLSDEQYKYVEMASQIYRPETLYKIYEPDEADRLAKLKIKEIVLMCGKGGGKNHSTVVVLARIIYMLLCLRDPAEYYGKPPGDAIDVLNVAVNAKQATNTFFNPFKERIRRTPWFRNRYTATRQGEIQFDKNVTCYSGHSEREAWEGYNFIFVVLDEIAAFATDSEVANSSNSDRVNSAAAIHKMYRASVTSRFPDVGKVALLSWPRFEGDYITERYNELVMDSEKSKHSHTFKLNDDLPDGIESNEFQIDWTEEHVTAVKFKEVYVAKIPSWRFNPQRHIGEYKTDFYDDPVDALSRYACNPPDSIDAFFRDRDRVRAAFSAARFPLNDDGTFADSFVPKEDTNYYIHVDLAEKSDRAAVAMSHVSNWTYKHKNTPMETIAPVITVDLVKWWSPSSEYNIDFSEIREFILYIRGRGFNIQTVSFDRWAGSIALQQELDRAGIKVETQSVQRNEYNNLSLLIAERRIDGYNIPLLIDELLGLRVMPNGKVDHTRSGTNDLADAVTGSVYDAAKYEQYEGSGIIEVSFLEDVQEPAPRPKATTGGPIELPKHEPPPEEISNFLERMHSI